ncbi:MAG TPA: pitrilysin family protein, partial [Alphaproteobacteria bacterium]|nr:pitrilysin family protein [Alphaproteobacteria bacterium]
AKDRILDIQEVTSPKGIKAWLVEDKDLPIISLQFSFKGAGAVNNSPEKQGLSRLLSNTMDEGAGDLTSQEFQKVMSDNSISLSFGSGRDDFGGRVETLSRNKEKAFELLTLALTKPRFDEEPLQRMKLANITRIRSSMGDPDWIEARLFNDLAYEGHPYALNSGGTISTLESITAEDLRQFKKDFLTKDRLVVSAAGDISPKELAKVLDQIFGDLPATGKQNAIKDIALQNTGKTFLYKKDIPQTLISVALPSFDRQDPDYYALMVMNHIYGASGFGSRLMEEAREKRGLTYGIYSGMAVQDYISTFSVSTSTKNATAKEILQIIKDEMAVMKKEPVSEQELIDAKAYIIGSMPLSLTSTSSIADIALDLQLKGRSITYLDDFPEKIQAVTAEDIKRVSARILNPETMLTVMVGSPEGIKNAVIKSTLNNVE